MMNDAEIEEALHDSLIEIVCGGNALSDDISKFSPTVLRILKDFREFKTRAVYNPSFEVVNIFINKKMREIENRYFIEIKYKFSSGAELKKTYKLFNILDG